MTKEIGINSTIRPGKKKLHLQTCFMKDSSRITTSIFHDGQLIHKQGMIVDENFSETYLEKEVKQFHETVIADLELLFFVASKIQITQNITFIEKLGYIFYEKGFYDEAIDQFQNVIKLDAKNSTAQFQIAKVLFKKENFSSTLEYLQSAVTSDPDNPEIYLLLGQTYKKLDDYEQSIQAIEKALVLDDVSAVAHYFMGLLLLESVVGMSKDKEALPSNDLIIKASQHFKLAVKLSPVYNAKIIERALKKIENPENIKDAIVDFEHAYHEQPEGFDKSIFSESEFYLKFMFTGSDKDNKELGHYIVTLEKAALQHPTDVDIRQSLGIAYLIRGWQYFAKATEEFRAIVAMNSSFQKAKQRLKLLENEGRGFLIFLRAILK